MSLSSLHGGGFSAVAIDPCVGVARLSRQEVSFNVYGAEGVLDAPQLVGSVTELDAASTTLTIANGARVAELVTGEGLKFYCRIAPSVKGGDQPESTDLEQLAELLKTSGSSRSGATPDTDIPAAYTYLGQFIAHELSDLRVLDPTGMVTIRSAALDLDSLLGAVPDTPLPAQAQIWKGGVGIGQARSFGPDVHYEDLPRRADGKALIADARNDSNLALAQLHLALSKFHQRIAQDECRRSDDAARRITRRHVQSVVLHDYLRRVIEPGVYDDILLHGRRVIHPGGLPTDTPFLIPIEFAAACFRVGHSMVREKYEAWEYGVRPIRLKTLLHMTGQGGGFFGLRHLSEEWRINWASMLEQPNPPSVRNMAAGIDATLAPGLHRLPDRLFPPSTPKGDGTGLTSVARATLLRQRGFELGSGQQTAHVLNGAIGPGLQVPVLTPPEIAAAFSDSGAVDTPLAEFLCKSGLHANTPLWFYCLVEARTLCGGRCFGPLTSRIVMETIHAAIEAAPDGIVAGDGRTITFTAKESLSGRREFHLQELIAHAARWQS